jgi:hypothetical protein
VTYQRTTARLALGGLSFLAHALADDLHLEQVRAAGIAEREAGGQDDPVTGRDRGLGQRAGRAPARAAQGDDAAVQAERAGRLGARRRWR